MPESATIPVLDAGGTFQPHEGATDFNLYARPKGTRKAVMIFVDFPDVPGTDDRGKVGSHLLGNGDAQRLFRDQSLGQMELDVTVESDLGWRTMPRKSTAYGPTFTTAEAHREYIRDAASLFFDVRFGDFDFTYVVAPRAAHFPVSPAFTVFKMQGARAPDGSEIRLAVTFGKDSYTNSFINLVHETGHLLGLTDLYPGGGGAQDSEAGCWSLMSDIFHSMSFLGWHRLKNGWLPSTRTRYLSRVAGRRLTLSPLSAAAGLSLVAFPIDSESRPSKVFALELAEPVVGPGGVRAGSGVLLYTVNAKIPTLKSPVRLLPRDATDDPRFGHLFGAPFQEGDTEVTHVDPDHGASLTLSVLRKAGTEFDVEVTHALG